VRGCVSSPGMHHDKPFREVRLSYLRYHSGGNQFRRCPGERRLNRGQLPVRSEGHDTGRPPLVLPLRSCHQASVLVQPRRARNGRARHAAGPFSAIEDRAAFSGSQQSGSTAAEPDGVQIGRRCARRITRRTGHWRQRRTAGRRRHACLYPEQPARNRTGRACAVIARRVALAGRFRRDQSIRQSAACRGRAGFSSCLTRCLSDGSACDCGHRDCEQV